MRLYLDDDSVGSILVRLLKKAGHDVLLPVAAGTSGEHDAVHLTYAIKDNRVLLSHNHHDFARLHNLIVEAKGRHPGILVVRKDNDPTKDMTARGIANAVAKLLMAQVPLETEIFVLNQWR